MFQPKMVMSSNIIHFIYNALRLIFCLWGIYTLHVIKSIKISINIGKIQKYAYQICIYARYAIKHANMFIDI